MDDHLQTIDFDVKDHQYFVVLTDYANVALSLKIPDKHFLDEGMMPKTSGAFDQWVLLIPNTRVQAVAEVLDQPIIKKKKTHKKISNFFLN